VAESVWLDQGEALTWQAAFIFVTGDTVSLKRGHSSKTTTILYLAKLFKIEEGKK
jgi:hypothetical protein